MESHTDCPMPLMNLTEVTNAGTLVMRVVLAFIKFFAAPASPCVALLLTVTLGRTAQSFNQRNQPTQASNKSFMSLGILLGFFLNKHQTESRVFSSDVHFTISEFFISSIMGKCLSVFSMHHEGKRFFVVSCSLFPCPEVPWPFHPTQGLRLPRLLDPRLLPESPSSQTTSR